MVKHSKVKRTDKRRRSVSVSGEAYWMLTKISPNNLSGWVESVIREAHRDEMRLSESRGNGTSGRVTGITVDPDASTTTVVEDPPAHMEF